MPIASAPPVARNPVASPSSVSAAVPATVSTASVAPVPAKKFTPVRLTNSRSPLTAVAVPAVAPTLSVEVTLNSALRNTVFSSARVSEPETVAWSEEVRLRLDPATPVQSSSAPESDAEFSATSALATSSITSAIPTTFTKVAENSRPT